MAGDKDFDACWSAAKSLAADFGANLNFYLSNEFQEAEVRKYFLDKLFKSAFGWDVDHEKQKDPYRREVRIEKPDRKANGRADYAFAIAPYYGRVRFHVEAKRPQNAIATPDNCFQTIRYSWPKGLPMAILTDFNHIHVLDTRFRPSIGSAVSRVVRSWSFQDFRDADKFAELYYLLSRNAVAGGSIEAFADSVLPTPRVAARQYPLFPGETRDFDEDFLDKLDEWREFLAGLFKRAKPLLDGEHLTECVQRVIDRLVFMRFLEDKQIESEGIIERFGSRSKTHWQDFINESRRLDRVYNGIVFKPHSIIDDTNFRPDAAAFSELCDELADERSPYNFDSIPVEILGRIYERFLGKVVLATPKRATVVDKEIVRKAGGVYYTPDYIVSYMVDNTLGAQIKNKPANDILNMRVIDTSCGSGSFLIAAFACLLRELTIVWRDKVKVPKGVVESRDGEVRLTLAYKREILLRCIFGVDIDAQATEVAQLSLYLKLMEDETTYSVHRQQIEIESAILPSLSRNVIVGNSLVTLDESGGDLFSVETLSSAKSLDFRAEFPQVFKAGGFDLLIGNPPYIKEFTYRDAFEHVRDSPYYQGKMDLWYLFACRGLDWLKPDSGILAFIATNNWTTSTGARKLREKIFNDARIEQLVDFGDFKVFRDAGIQTMIVILRRSKPSEPYTFDFRRLEGQRRPLLSVQALLTKLENPDCVYLTPLYDREKSPGAPLTFTAAGGEALLDKIASRRNFRLADRDIAQGIVGPQDFVNKKSYAALGGKARLGEGIFILTDEEKDSLGLTTAEQSLVKPFYTTSEMGRYFGSSLNRFWIIYTNSSYGKKAAINPYPHLKHHLDRFARVITSSNAPYGLHRARDERFFTGEKILAVRKCEAPAFTYTDFPCYVSQTFNIIKTDRVDLLFLTALLNSRVVRYWLRHRGKMQGGNFQVDKEPLLSIPLRIPDEPEQSVIARQVRQILAYQAKMLTEKTHASRDQLERKAGQHEQAIQERMESLYELGEDDRTALES